MPIRFGLKKTNASNRTQYTYNEYWTPKLKQDEEWNPTADAKVGMFAASARNNDALSNLANALSCDGSYRIDEISSIPDIWARPLFFQQMLYYNEQDPVLGQLRNEAKIQWRILLCILAMSGHYTDLGDVDIARIDRGGAGNGMIATLYDLPPINAQIWRSFGWETVSIVKVTDANGMVSPLAFCHPATLVSPAADCWERLANRVPFVKTVPQTGVIELADPAQVLSGADAEFMKTWLRWLLRQVDEGGRMGRSVLSTTLRHELSVELTAFEQDIQASAHDASMLEDIPVNDSFADYLLLARNKIALVPNELVIGRNTSGAPMIVLDANIPNPSFATQLFRDAFQTAPNSARARIPQGASVRLARELFLDRLCVIRAYSGETPNISGMVKYPLADNEELVVLLPIAEDCGHLVNEVTVEPQFSDYQQKNLAGVRVQWRIKTLQGKQCVVGRDYAVEKGDVTELDIDELNATALWPNRNLPDWREYYLYTDTGSAPRYLVKPLQQDQQADRAPIAREGTGRKIKMTYYRLNRFPSVLCCVDVEDNKYLGMFPVNQNESNIPEGDGEFTVSMDFGTSSSVIYCKQGSWVAKPLELNNSVAVLFRKLQKGQDDDGTRDQSLISRYFLPGGTGEKITIPFATLYLQHNEGQQLFLDGHIYFKRNIQNLRMPSKNVGKLLANTKWGNNGSMILYQMALMACLQARLSGYSSVQWKVSYPISMSRAEVYLRDYRETCEAAMRSAGLLPQGMSMEESQFISITESEAAARFFAKNVDVNINRDNIAVVDVGGGSSDLFVYTFKDDRGIAYAGSIRLGARDLLLDLLRKRPGFLIKALDAIKARRLVGKEDTLQGIGSEVLERLAEERENEDASAFNQEVESIFSYEMDKVLPGGGTNGKISIGDKLAEFIAWGYERGGVSEELKRDIILFKSILATNIMPVFYYLGLMIRHIDENHGCIRDIPDVGVAGNGSNMLRWLGMDDKVNKLIFTMLKGAAGIQSEGGKVVLSPKLKHEAAMGMTHEPITVNRESISAKPLLICGEKVISTANGETRSIEALDVLTHELLASRMELDPINGLTQFSNMLERLNFFVNLRDDKNVPELDLYGLELRDGGQRDVEILENQRKILIKRGKLMEQVNAELIRYCNAINKNDSNTDERPVFIAVSKGVRDLLAIEWTNLAKKDKY